MKYDIPEDVRREAWEIGLKRNEIALRLGRMPGKFHPDYTDMEIHHQGIMGELMVQDIYPSFVLAQPMIIDGWDTGGLDFNFGTLKLEVKCNRWYRDYPSFFVNVQRLLKKKPDAVMCTSIEDKPSVAKVFTVHGCVLTTEIMKYPIRKDISSPAYEVPVTILRDINGFKPRPDNGKQNDVARQEPTRACIHGPQQGNSNPPDPLLRLQAPAFQGRHVRYRLL